MTWYGKQDNIWTERSSLPSDAPTVQVQADTETPPEIRFLRDRNEFFHLSGVPPRPATETTHTVAAINYDGAEGALLFAVHAVDNEMTFEDLRSPQPPAAVNDDRLDSVRSSLQEIMIPVYIDDVISDFSEGYRGLVALHTAQYDGENQSAWTYFRTSLFKDGDLVLEEEHGAL